MDSIYGCIFITFSHCLVSFLGRRKRIDIVFVLLTIRMLGKSHSLLLSADFFQNSRSEIPSEWSNGLDPDQARHFVGPYLGTNCL